MGQRAGEVEDVVIAPASIDAASWRGRRVFLTGHTGFKGAWASLLLASLGAEVHGYALPADDGPCLFRAAGVEGDVRHCEGDVRDLEPLRAALVAAEPEVVIHMAAQALVRPAYADPVGTYATNVMGTVNLLEAARTAPSVRAVVVVTTDKCYENTGSLWGYRENEALGGHDPYSNSKACAELVADAFRRSFFHRPGAAAVATARAGNVIGGGDWAVDRLVPDAMRAFGAGEPLRIRNPAAVRPWQHALDPVLGYLRLAEALLREPARYAEGWNFGPAAASEVPVEHIVDGLVRRWGGDARWEHDGGEHVHEAAYLKLDCTKAAARLGWHPALGLEAALDLTVDWYRALAEGGDMRALSLAQISGVLRGAAARAVA